MKKEITDLVLLIGTSPLPNYVVAKYFIDNYPGLKKIWLLHSDKTSSNSSTEVYAENIVKILKKNTKFTNDALFKIIALRNIENFKRLKTELRDKIKIADNADSVYHINITGGTKLMVLQCYDYFKENENIEKEFSYLSARTFDLVNDQDDIMQKDLRKKVTVSLDDLIALSDFRRCNKPADYDFSSANAIFDKLLENGKLNNFYNSENGWDRKNFRNKKDEWFQLSEFEKPESPINRTKPGDFLNIVSAMPEELRIYDKNGDFNKSGAKYLKDSLGYLDGKWLEEVVYNKISNAFKQLQVEKNWEINKKEWNSNNSFEIDIILINGYQMVGISCTTIGDKGGKALIKSKGFEILQRTRQIGGDEAKSVLVTKTSTAIKQVIEEELQIETGGSNNIIVIGADELKNNGSFLERISTLIK
ncbi:MAG: hypothetical protein WCJ01_11640 [Ignavibacteria bacterium]